MVIKVLNSKNYQLRKGCEVIFSEISSTACPCKLLKRYLARFSSLLAPGISFLDPSLERKTAFSSFPRTSLSAAIQ